MSTPSLNAAADRWRSWPTELGSAERRELVLTNVDQERDLDPLSDREEDGAISAASGELASER
jgi:hypothetical protein